MKLKQFITTILILAFVSFSFAQKNKEERKAKRIAFITNRLELTPQESKDFWPIFDQRNAAQQEKLKPLKKGKRKGRKKIEEMSNNEVLSLLDTIFIIRQIELDIQKKYHSKLLKILPPKKVAKLYHIEKRFRQHHKKGKKPHGNSTRGK